MKGKRITVIGGSGFIGTHLAGRLMREGHRVNIYDIRPSMHYPAVLTRGDIRDRVALSRAVAGADIIINLAAEHRDNVLPLDLYRDVNVGGAENVVWVAEEHGISTIVFTSTVALYGLDAKDPDEHATPSPFNEYGRSKLAAELIYTEWARHTSNRTLTIIRPSVVFGENNRGNVYNLIRQMMRRSFIMVGNGSNRKSMAYVGNLAAFIVRSLEFPAGEHLYNYADKPDMTTNELINIIRRELDMRSPLLRVPYPVGLAGGYLFDLLAMMTRRQYPISSIRIKKFCSDTTISTDRLESLGFTPEVSVTQGIQMMIAALRSAQPNSLHK